MKRSGAHLEANKPSELPEFANLDNLDSGVEMVKELTNSLAIFENHVLVVLKWCISYLCIGWEVN